MSKDRNLSAKCSKISSFGFMKRRYRPGIEESSAARSAKAQAHLESMRDDYVKIVQRRLADPKLPTLEKKLSVYGIAKELTALGHRAPKNKSAKVPYRVTKNLADYVGEVEPLPTRKRKTASELGVGDRVRVFSPERSFHGDIGEVREVMREEDGFRIAVGHPSAGRKIKFVRAHEIRHILD